MKKGCKGKCKKKSKIKIKSVPTGKILKDDKDLILKVERLIETIRS